LTEQINGAVTLREHLLDQQRPLRSAGVGSQQRGAAARLATDLKWMHETGVDHRNLTAERILVSQHGTKYKFWFLGVEDIELCRRVPLRRIYESLARLNASCLSLATVRNTDRLRFLKRYLATAFRAQWKTCWKQVAAHTTPNEATRAKRSIREHRD
jgi:hypothetical protein